MPEQLGHGQLAARLVARHVTALLVRGPEIVDVTAAMLCSREVLRRSMIERREFGASTGTLTDLG
jgi:hypothetical protein